MCSKSRFSMVSGEVRRKSDQQYLHERRWDGEINGGPFGSGAKTFDNIDHMRVILLWVLWGAGSVYLLRVDACDYKHLSKSATVESGVVWATAVMEPVIGTVIAWVLLCTYVCMHV